MSAIFISHSSKDNLFCQKLINWLDELGHRSVFLDFDENSGIAGGQDWEQKLYKELRVCSAMIVVCTEDLMNSKWCFAEITHARSLGKQIFPIQIAPCDINSILSNTQVIDFINLEETVAFERLKQGIIKAGIDAKDPYAWDGSRPPYPGLLAFQEEDAAIFFGREKEIREGLDVLTSTHRYGGSGLIMVLGASGSGKSSLVRAGIIPRLKRDPERWLVLNPIQPGEDPFRELAKALKKAFQNFAKEEYSIDELYGQLQSDLQLAKDSSKDLESKPQFKNYDVFDKLHEAADLANASILFTIDQFEELLDRPEEHLGTQFLYFLKSMLHKKESKLIVLGTMRSDFLGMFQQNSALLGLEFGKILVGPVDIESLTEIIEKPAELAGVRIEPKLVQGLIEDTRTDDSLPLMAFTLRELYDNYSEDNLLEFREYEALGGIHGSVAKSAEGVLSNPKLTTSQEELLRKAFLQMTRVNEQGNFTRNRVAWNDINPETHEVLNRLVSGRLLVSSTDGNDIRTLEVAHESLFRSWKRLKTWLDEDREFLLWRNRLNNSIEDWESSKDRKTMFERQRESKNLPFFLRLFIPLVIFFNLIFSPRDKYGRHKIKLLDRDKATEANFWMRIYEGEINAKEKFFIEKSLKKYSFFATFLQGIGLTILFLLFVIFFLFMIGQ